MQERERKMKRDGGENVKLSIATFRCRNTVRTNNEKGSNNV